ncbi:MAG: hypothetical protein GXP45_03475 [bacterium]|nr:hypothetical protein [bacterium]
MMKRGCEVILFHAYAPTIDQKKLKEKIFKLAEVLAKYQFKIMLFLVPYKDIQRELVQSVNQKYRMLLFKRSIVRMANRVAEEVGAKAIIM